jgi:Protein of Unknown function (DUF2784)
MSVLLHALADAVLLLHGAFLLFVAGGGLMVLRRPRLAWIHLPAVAWGALVELTGWICPLTPLENALRRRAGAQAYAGDFIEHYLLRLLYPEGLSRPAQLVLGTLALAVNAVIYGWLIRRRHRVDGRSDRGEGS